MLDIINIAIIVLLALAPGLEVRASIPYGVLLGFNPLGVFLLSYIMSCLPSIPIIYLLGWIEENLVPRYDILQKLYNWAVKRVRKKLEEIRRSKYIFLALAAYVAIPLPLTGVWTGSLIAYLLGLDRKKSILAIIMGNIVASTIVLLTSLGLLHIAGFL